MRPCAASSTGYRRLRASTCIARRSSSPPCSPSPPRQRFGLEGRIHFNVGGSQAVEDSLKLVRNAKNGKSLMFAFEGGYHGRTLGASAITSSYRYRRRYGHFGDRAHFVPFPYHFRGPKGMSKEEYGNHCVQQFARLFESEYNGVWDPRAGQAEFAAFYVEPIQGTGGYVIPPKNFFVELKKVLDQHGILLVVDEIQMGFYRTGKLFAIEHFGVKPDIIVFGKAITNGLNPLAGIWAREELISPQVFPPGSTHSTFNANPMGTGVALEAMRMMAETDYEAMVMEKGAYLLAGLEDLKRRHKIVGDVDGLGMALRMEICEPHDSFTPSKADRRPHGGRGAERRHRGRRQAVRPRARYRRLLQERGHAGAEPAHQQGRDGPGPRAARPRHVSRKQGVRSSGVAWFSSCRGVGDRRSGCGAAFLSCSSTAPHDDDASPVATSGKRSRRPRLVRGGGCGGAGLGERSALRREG